MELETLDVIDIEGLEENSDCCVDSESIHESIHCEAESIHREIWFSAADAKHRLRLDKTPFQRAISELVTIYQLPMSALRRGEARNTEYSQTCISLVRALKSGDEQTFDRLKQYLQRFVVGWGRVFEVCRFLSYIVGEPAPTAF